MDDQYPEFGSIKKTSFSDSENNLNIQQPQIRNTNSRKTLILIIVLLLAASIIGGFFLFKNKGSIKSIVSHPTPTASPIPTPTPAETPGPSLNRSEWSFELQNGSGATGLAKKVADKIKDLGYAVVKTGNADKSNYPTTQVLVKKGLEEKLDLVIADLKDVVKIASYGGELKDSTASARIILGKDSI